MKVAVDVTPLRLTRAGTARYLESLLPRVEREATVERLRGFSAGRAGTLWLDLAWYPHVLPHRAKGADVLHCPTYRGPVRSEVPLVVTVHDLAVFRHPEAFPRVDADVRRVVVPRVVRAARIVLAVSEFTASELETLLHVPRERIRVVPNAVDDAFTPDGPRAEGRLRARRRHARAAQEPRAHDRGGAAARRSSCASSARAGWGGVEARGRGRHVARRRRRRGARAPVPRRAAASSTRRCTRASASRCSRRWRAARPSSRRAAARRRRSRAARQCSSTRSTSRRSRPASRRRSRAATSCARPGSNARARSRGTSRRGGRCERLRGGA